MHLSLRRWKITLSTQNILLCIYHPWVYGIFKVKLKGNGESRVKNEVLQKRGEERRVATSKQKSKINGVFSPCFQQTIILVKNKKIQMFFYLTGKKINFYQGISREINTNNYHIKNSSLHLIVYRMFLKAN